MGLTNANDMTVRLSPQGRADVGHVDTMVDSSARSPRELADGLARDADRELLGGRVGRYRVLDRLGEGGMGRVLEALDETLDRKVALKLLHDRRRGNDELRLIREAQALARLSHPNVVQVYEVGQIEGRLFIAMERVEGTTLERWHDHARPWQEIVKAYLQAGRGLVAAHEAGLVHRDFKPTNCIIDAHGRVRVLDFGLARAAGSLEEAPTPMSRESEPDQAIALRESVTQTGSLLGTVAYMAPEQLEGKPADERSDQFAFCVSLYEALYRRSPFQRQGVRDPRELAADGAPALAPDDPSVPKALWRVLRRGLSLQPSDRWPTMQVLLERLHRVPTLRRHARWAAALGLTVLGLGGLSSGPMSTAIDPMPEPDEPAIACSEHGRASLTDRARLEAELVAATDRGDDERAAALARTLSAAYEADPEGADAARSWRILARTLERRSGH